MCCCAALFIAPVYPEEWLRLRGHLAGLDGNSIGVENFDTYRSAILSYGDYLLANMALPDTGAKQQQKGSKAGMADGSGRGMRMSEASAGGRVEDGDGSSDDEEDDIYEAFAMAQLRLEMQDALFSRVGVDCGQILGSRTG